ncbi:MAG TPA: hypothetical protein VL379_01845 [Pseudomonadales bacterium]|jgi:hypothetical protein|nr:hypothetical protein [Pseudomonadales bacterium]
MIHELDLGADRFPVVAISSGPLGFARNSISTSVANLTALYEQTEARIRALLADAR